MREYKLGIPDGIVITYKIEPVVIKSENKFRGDRGSGRSQKEG